MEIKTKYNINDTILFKDDVDNIISAKVLRIETYITDANLGIKYITKYGTVYEDDVIDKNDFLNELNNTNNKNKTNPIEVITMTFRTFDEPVKPKYNVGQLVEYYYKGDKYISIIEKIIYNDKDITYKVLHDGRNFSEKEIKSIELNIDDEIIYFIPYNKNRIIYRYATIVHIYPDCVTIKNDDGYELTIKYDQLIRRI